MSTASQAALLAALAEHGIPYLRVDHPAVYTCEEAAELVPPIEGAETKNLFLRDDKRSRYFLVSLPAEKSADLKLLAGVLGVKRLTMASPEDLADYLGVVPGSVTLLAAFNDHAGRVEIKLDAELAEQERLLCHPLVNTATLSIAVPDLSRFLALSGHGLEVIEVPARTSTPA